ncbi:hypothetical protein Avbf_16360 [Armadillidium vulgare]|nr:hypothetical protein Avbf_16360 [Armadillidium vulgare]
MNYHFETVCLIYSQYRKLFQKICVCKSYLTFRKKPTTILCNLFHWLFLLKESPCCVLNASHLSWTLLTLFLSSEVMDTSVMPKSLEMAKASTAATSSILDSLEETILSDMGIAEVSNHLRGKEESFTSH